MVEFHDIIQEKKTFQTPLNKEKTNPYLNKPSQRISLHDENYQTKDISWF